MLKFRTDSGDQNKIISFRGREQEPCTAGWLNKTIFSIVTQDSNFKCSVWKVRDLLVLIFVIFLFTASGGDVKEMNFDEFREFLKNESIGEFEVTFNGVEISVPVSSNKYIFFQIVTYCGEGDMMSSFRIWNSDEEFILVYKNIRVTMTPAKVRTFIEQTGSFIEKNPDDGRMLPSAEFGIVKNKKYYAKISSEDYHLPPDHESRKPRRRTNHVLWISSKPYVNGQPQIELTPMYKRWSY